MFTERTEQRVPIEHRSIERHELHFHLGDILPHDMNYENRENAELRIVLHFSDPYGRHLTRTISIPETVII